MAPKQAQLQIFIQANIAVGKKLKTCQGRPHLVSGRFIKVFYKTTTCPRQPLFGGPKSGLLIQVWLEYSSSVVPFQDLISSNITDHHFLLKTKWNL